MSSNIVTEKIKKEPFDTTLKDIALADEVRSRFKSGNSIEVERIVLRRSDIAHLL